ncbi:unnamed protein product [Spirodela intermedia]|uniref:C3H1-type domain-containing protein n=1 Tax=Spirodela intermedia TaxID=51605 RepID=A0A7I8IDN9_SPIIN|nr:unnamed protein product [Spirodela intermedia]CAA6655908.1 unnamed protein product [Spirodela intermedia]
MAGLKQSKRVSWAPAVKLCQVRLFLSDDTPSQSGSGAQDHLQAKASWLWHSREAVNSDEYLPPGFEAPPLIQQQPKAVQIPLIKWKVPLKFSLNQEWLVVAGEESKEVELQNQRQLGVFEAIYPRLSSIPPNPISSEESQDLHHDEAQTPLIPVNAIEDDPTDELDLQAALDTSRYEQQHSEVIERVTMDIPTLPRGPAEGAESGVPSMPNDGKPVFAFPPGVEPDVVAAASAAFTALMRSSEEGSLIDRDLLIKILSNPSLIEKLLAEYGTPRQQQPPAMIPAAVRPALPAESAAALPTPKNPPPLLSTEVGLANTPPVRGPPMRDMSYFKTLIQQHGGDGYEVMDPGYAPFDRHHNYLYKDTGGGSNVEQGNQSTTVHRDPKSRIPKPCVYFNSPRGCRNGASCLYIHDGSLPQRNDRQSRKKIKLDKETIRRG